MRKSIFIELLSKKYVSFIIIALAIFIRAIQLIFFYNIRVDASYQVMATQSLLDGHGVSIASVSPNDLSSLIYSPLINWPPGYSLLLSPFYFLFRPSYEYAGILLDILGAILFIIYSRGILKELMIPMYLRNLFTLASSFFIYYFYFIASSDAIAIAFFLGGIFYSLKLVQYQESWKKHVLLCSLFLIIAAYIKYLFIPLVFIIPILTGYTYRKEKIVLRASGLIVSLLTLSIGGLLVYQKLQAGTSMYVSAPGRGFFPEHLQGIYPFIISSFIKPDTATLVSFVNESIVYRIFQLLTLLIGISISLFLIRSFKKQEVKVSNTYAFFFQLSFLLSLGLLLLLAALSIRVEKEEILPGVFWTYVEEARYFGLACILLQLSAVILLYLRRQYAKRISILLFFFPGLFVIEVSRGVVFTANRLKLMGKEEYSWQHERSFEQYADTLIKAKKKEYHVSNVVYTGTWYYLSHRVSIYSHVPLINDVGRINDLNLLHTSKPTLLIVCLPKTGITSFEPFLQRVEHKYIGEWEGYYFYSEYVAPH